MKFNVKSWNGVLVGLLRDSGFGMGRAPGRYSHVILNHRLMHHTRRDTRLLVAYTVFFCHINSPPDSFGTSTIVLNTKVIEIIGRSLAYAEVRKDGILHLTT